MTRKYINNRFQKAIFFIPALLIFLCFISKETVIKIYFPMCQNLGFSLFYKNGTFRWVKKDSSFKQWNITHSFSSLFFFLLCSRLSKVFDFL